MPQPTPQDCAVEFVNLFKQAKDTGTLDRAYEEMDKKWAAIHQILSESEYKSTIRHCLDSDETGAIWLVWHTSGFEVTTYDSRGNHLSTKTLSEIPAHDRVRYYNSLIGFFNSARNQLTTVLSVLPPDPREEHARRLMGSR